MSQISRLDQFTTDIGLGDHGPGVLPWRRALVALGFLRAAPTQVCDEEMQKALVSYQRATHITPDGVIGIETRDRLLQDMLRQNDQLRAQIPVLIAQRSRYYVPRKPAVKRGAEDSRSEPPTKRARSDESKIALCAALFRLGARNEGFTQATLALLPTWDGVCEIDLDVLPEETIQALQSLVTHWDAAAALRAQIQALWATPGFATSIYTVLPAGTRESIDLEEFTPADLAKLQVWVSGWVAPEAVL